MSSYVQFGAGLCGPEKWLNYDASPTLRLQRLPLVGVLFHRVGPVFPREVQYGDIVRGLPVANDSCDAVYSSHVLEHLSLEGCRSALANAYRCLRPGGRFRCVLPDLERHVRRYVENSAPNAAVELMERTILGRRSRPKGVSGLVRSWLGNSEHLWMWDYKALATELAEVGFIDIRRAEFGDTGDPLFELVEDPQRWEDALGIDCTKPEK